ncbi:hypothetical protein [Paracoccus sp. J56]|uniref:hypothetical protein n=1 Tax=Paracoccus sp. J56 TaxID=935850 RepID=UPI000A098581|nr:hypothetical protein [Paracoccus sp. J56]SMG53951.1 hypothetical protein SAMN02746000_03506 [Paracoccus sp. J56]
MTKCVALTDALTGATEIFAQPPWHLEGIRHFQNGDLVKLVHDDGTTRLMPIRSCTSGLFERFRDW